MRRIELVFGISIGILFLLLIFYVLPQLEESYINVEKSNCSEVYGWEYTCRLDGGMYSPKNCDEYENGIWDTGARKGKYRLQEYKCTGTIIVRK